MSRPLKKPESRASEDINLRVTRDTKEQWKAMAKAEGLTLSAWIQKRCRDSQKLEWIDLILGSRDRKNQYLVEYVKDLMGWGYWLPGESLYEGTKPSREVAKKACQDHFDRTPNP